MGSRAPLSCGAGVSRVQRGLVRNRACRRLLACLLTGVALTTVACGENSSERKAKATYENERSRQVSEEEATAVLGRLTRPREFRQGTHCLLPDSVCFARRTAIVPTRSDLNRVVGVLGARIESSTVSCSRRKRSRVPRLALFACTARATSGRDLLLVALTSVVEVTPTGVRGTKRRLPGGRSGATLEVSDIGH